MVRHFHYLTYWGYSHKFITIPYFFQSNKLKVTQQNFTVKHLQIELPMIMAFLYLWNMNYPTAKWTNKKTCFNITISKIKLHTGL